MTQQRVGSYGNDESVPTACNLAPSAHMRSDAELVAAKEKEQRKQAIETSKALARATARARWKEEHPPQEDDPGDAG